MSTTWQALPQPSEELFEARLEWHYALQIPAAVSRLYAEKQAHYAHTNFAWNDRHRALLSQATPEGIRAGLVFEDLLMFLEKEGSLIYQESLIGKSMTEGFALMSEALAKHVTLDKSLKIAGYDMPHHAVRENARFTPSELYSTIGAWFQNATTALLPFEQTHDGSPVRCWPHHVDIATLITLEPHADPEQAKSVGLGMTPGDEGTKEPYWYVTPWPYPATTHLPALAGKGTWNTEGWVGALLTASDMTKTKEEQAAQVKAFLHSAVEASQKLLNA